MTIETPPGVVDADAFDTEAVSPDPDSDAEAERLFNATHDADGNPMPQERGTDDAYEGVATLQQLTIANRSNGKNYLLKFEVDSELGQVIFEERDGHDVFWRGFKIADAAMVKSGSTKRIADGRKVASITLQMAENWAHQSGSKIAADDLVGAHGKMKLIPMQTKMDLTTRAE